MTVRITEPLAAHGVGTERRIRCACGMRASIWLSVSRVRATRPSSRTKAAMPSTVRPNSGTTNPPRPSAAKITSSAAAAVVSASREVGVQVDLHAVEPADLLGDPGRGHRQRHPAVPQLGGHQVEHDEQRPLVADERALLVDEVDPLADRVEPDAERRPGRRHDLGEPLHARPVLRHGLGRA